MDNLTTLLDTLKIKEETPRNYIGASSIGDPCLRKLWYRYNQYKGKPISNKIQRTFDIGKTLEKYIITLLQETGLDLLCESLDFADRDLDYFRGNVDIIMYKDRFQHAIIEIKTAKDASFNIFKKSGLLKWNPIYYAQLQTYLGMSGCKVGILLALNKDTSEFHDEEIRFSSSFYKTMREKARSIANAKSEPEKINESPCFYACKMCEFREICHK